MPSSSSRRINRKPICPTQSSLFRPDTVKYNPPRYVSAAGRACRKVRKVTPENNVSRFQTAYDIDNFIRPV
ncbi:hypothetical protein [Neisseria lactamica]|uniref:Uncharacterized protein n=2 Tax=Neisseria lactamica TaxID=486 RepID=A0AAU8VU55_NEILA|nr:hypothetical protein [Neisseria lactamica]ARB04889.1 hypothetical protein B2G52_08345 [Neisseria lactamica]